MFMTEVADVTRQLTVSKYALLATPESQNTRMTSNFILSTYSSTWLNQSVPAFTTNEYAIAPFNFQVESSDGAIHSPNGTLTSTSMRYWAELSCWTPSSIILNLTTNSVSFDDGQGCLAEDMLSFNSSITDLYPNTAEYEAYVFGPGSEGYDPFAIGLQAQCPNRTQLFLMTFRRAGSSTPDFNAAGNATAMFCEPQYYVEPVMASISAADFSVMNYRPMNNDAQVLSRNDFNSSRFEYTVSRGVPPTQGTMANLTGGRTLSPILELSNVLYVRQDRHIQNMSIITPNQASTDILIGFALGLTQLNTEAYLDFSVLSDAYNKAYQALFARAVSLNFDVRNESAINQTIQDASTQSANLQSLEEVVSLNEGFTVATETFLGVASFLCLCLLMTIPGWRLNLQSNPESLAKVMRLSSSAEVREVFAEFDDNSNATIGQHCAEIGFHLDAQDGLICYNEGHQPPFKTSKDTSSSKPRRLSSQQRRPTHPVEMSWTVSTAILVSLLVTFTTLIVLSWVVHRDHGIPLPGHSGFIQQFVLNFVPTASASLLGLYVSLVCRSYSFLRPMQDLSRGGAKAKSTLSVKYTSLPPALPWYAAIRARHYILTGLSFSVLLSNVAAVTMAGIFIMQQTTTGTNTQISPFHAPNVVYTSDFIRGISVATTSANVEAYYPMLATFTEGAPLPPWTSRDLALLPQDLTQISMQSGVTPAAIQLDLIGYGADLDCSDFRTVTPGVNKSFDLVRNGTSFRLWANFTLPSGEIKYCGWDHSATLGQPSLGQLSTVPNALELSYFLMLYNASGSFQDDFCPQQIIKGWIRGWLEHNSEPDAAQVQYNSTIVLCKAQLLQQPTKVNVTADGNVLSLKTTGQQITPSSDVNLTAPLNTSLLIYRDTYMLPAWHGPSDLVARDLSNELYIGGTGNRNFLNASMPPPTTDVAVGVVSDTFRTLFAVQISVDQPRLQRYNQAESTDAEHTDVELLSDTDIIQAKIFSPTSKVFMSTLNLIVSLTIIAATFVALATLRLTLPRSVLPRMPTTITSQIAYFASSRVVDDVVNGGRDLDDQTYSYGRFIGKDGKVHTGIERQVFVYL